MTKRVISLLLALLLAASAVSALAESFEEMAARLGFPKIMYVYTENGGKLNVRSEPRVKDGNVVEQIEFGTEVKVLAPVAGTAEWYAVENAKAPNKTGFVMTRYLVETKPEKSQQQIDEAAEKAANLEELNRQLATLHAVEQPFMIAVRAARTSGWVNFRVGPGIASDRISSLPDGRELKVVGETSKWYQATDMETGKTGFISKNYATVLPSPVETVTNDKESLGKLDVNGAFTLQCKLPEGYSLQVVNMRGTKIVASVLSEDKEKPMLYLSVAYDEVYSNVERMNDLSEEDLKVLEASFTDMNEVEISYKETAYGTKLLIAKEVGEDTDFVDILSIYKGYFVEFIMTPNPDASSQKLTDAQIQMCIDFLSEVDFIPAA